MAVEVISAETVVWAAGADPAGQSITIPSDATAVYMLWSYSRNATGSGLASATINDNAPDETHEFPTTPALNACGVAAWYSPATGSQTLDPEWDGSPAGGPTTIVVYAKGVDLTGWREVQSDSASGATTISLTFSGVLTTDLVLASDQRFNRVGPPPLMSGYTSAATQTNGGKTVRAEYNTGLSGSVDVDAQGEDYSSLVALTIPEEAVASASFLSSLRRSQKALLVR